MSLQLLRKLPITTLLLLVTPVEASAQDPEKIDLQWGGILDTYYSYNFNRPSQPAYGTALPSATNSFRYYDAYHNQLSLSLAELSLTAKYKEVSLTTDLDFGTFADLNAGNGVGPDEVSKHIGQAVLRYRPDGSRFFFAAGKMYSHLGLESVKAKDNSNYSRSTLFAYGIPFWHTGIQAGYDWIPEKLQSSLCVYNGWNSLYDNNQSKTLGAQVKWTPASSTTIAYNYIGGPERANSERDWRQVHEVNTSWNFGADWILGTDALYGFETNVPAGSVSRTAKWYGGLASLRYQVTDKSYVSPRFEIFRDQDGAMLAKGAQTLKSATLTYGRTIATGLETRAEGRIDKSNQNVFTKGGGNTDTQSTLLAALLFSF